VVPRRASSLSVTVALLSVAWIIAILALTWLLFSIGLQQWADSYSDNGEAANGYAVQSAQAGLWLAAVLAVGPVLLAALARAGRMRKTFVVFVILSVLLVPVGAVGGAEMWRTLQPNTPPPSQPTHCVEFSGGDTSCPGG
jgi:hypothetical protein